VEEIKQAIIDAGSDDELVFGFPEKEGGLHIQQNPDEYAEFVHYVATHLPPAKLAIDIGIAAGGQTKFLRDYYPVEKTLIVDIGLHPKFHHWARIRQLVKTDIVLELIADSHTREVREALLPYRGQVDFAFIDGDHSYTGLKKDIELVKVLARPGATFILHDTTAVPDCAQVSEELKTDPDFELLRDINTHFGISIWKYLAVKAPKGGWLWRTFGW